MSHAFISYVEENSYIVDYIIEILKANDVPFWINKEDINPGLRWKDALRQAIQSGSFFVPVFSREWIAKLRSVANEELVEAIEELRRRPQNSAWLIPLRIDDCEIPDIRIGAGDTLRDLQWIDFPRLGWTKALIQLLNALGAASPKLDVGEPLGAGLSSNVDLADGALIYERSSLPVPLLKGAIFPITAGWCTRDSVGRILAYVQTRATTTHMQELNVRLGLDSFYALCEDRHVSNDIKSPNIFRQSRRFTIPQGTDFFNPITGEKQFFLIDLVVETSYIARGYFLNGRFAGTWEGFIRYCTQPDAVIISIDGSFDVKMVPSNRPRQPTA